MNALKIAALILVLLPRASVAAAASGERVSFASLLQEMGNREVLARFPHPAYSCRQFSSYDRASVSPGDRETWFGNRDWGNFLRAEEASGRKEWVMMDAEGPGAVVRIWSANPKGTLRIYLDHGTSPVIEAPMADVLDGKWRVGSPLAAVRSRGHNLYLPIPYEKHCKITSDENGFYYLINTRTYEGGTPVETFTPEVLHKAQKEIIDCGKMLLLEEGSPHGTEGLWVENHGRVNPGGALRLRLPPGPKVIRRLDIRFPERSAAGQNRFLVLCGTFDGVESIWCPVSDFFGLGAGAESLKDFYRRAGSREPWSSLWPMPYEKEGEIAVANRGESPVEVAVSCSVAKWPWDDRSMHFYARWTFQHPIPTRPLQDWNYVTVQGKGVYVGDSLSVINPIPHWWGEGDEKIYIDLEEFPSHFGTGTEDYYGYAWCCNEPFQAPFHSQSRCDGFQHGNNWGHTTVSRVRALDAIPFRKSLKFDMEIWHHQECTVGYAVATFFYALPGARHNRFPLPEAVEAPIPQPAPLPPPFKIDGALECETMEITGKSEDLAAEGQNMQVFGREAASGERQLWVRGRMPGDFVELRFPAPGEERYRVFLYAIRSWDYGIVRFYVNGRQAGADTDLFNQNARAVAPTGPIDLGIAEPVGRHMTLRVEVVGGNSRSEGTKSYFGLDCVVLIPASSGERGDGN